MAAVFKHYMYHCGIMYYLMFFFKMYYRDQSIGYTISYHLLLHLFNWFDLLNTFTRLLIVYLSEFFLVLYF